MGSSLAQTAVLSARRTLLAALSTRGPENCCPQLCWDSDVSPAVRNSSVCYQLALVRLSVRGAAAAGRDERAIFGWLICRLFSSPRQPLHDVVSRPWPSLALATVSIRSYQSHCRVPYTYLLQHVVLLRCVAAALSYRVRFLFHSAL